MCIIVDNCFDLYPHALVSQKNSEKPIDMIPHLFSAEITT